MPVVTIYGSHYFALPDEPPSHTLGGLRLKDPQQLTWSLGVRMPKILAPILTELDSEVKEGEVFVNYERISAYVDEEVAPDLWIKIELMESEKRLLAQGQIIERVRIALAEALPELLVHWRMKFSPKIDLDLIFLRGMGLSMDRSFDVVARW